MLRDLLQESQLVGRGSENRTENILKRRPRELLAVLTIDHLMGSPKEMARTPPQPSLGEQWKQMVQPI